MPDRRETMGGYVAREKVEYPDKDYFTIPDYRPDKPDKCPVDGCYGMAGHDSYGPEDGWHISVNNLSFFIEPDGDEDEYIDVDNLVRIPAHYEVCGTCHGHGTMVNPSIDSNGITQSEMEEFRENYFAGVYDVTCSECKGRRVVLEPTRTNLSDTEREVLEAYEIALAEEGAEIDMRNRGIQF